MRKKCFLFLLTGIPDQVNRAIYQRALYLSDKVNLHIFLGKNTNLSPKIKEKSNVYRFFFPSCIFKKLKLFEHLLEIFLFTLCIVIKLIPQKKLFIY
ncbi:MAG: hypothetical protein J7J93_00870, partial [Candidatus Aenigmarchaeota archaeon]|nr:hypothetical protein [Candidatus Aenigmarchaeota archaeon]